MSTPKGTVPWNAGTSKGWTDKRGYHWIYETINGKRKPRRAHRVIMERHIGRPLEPWELVHHKDGNPANNDISNLELKDFGQHTIDHHTGSHHTQHTKQTMELIATLRNDVLRLRDTKADLLAALKEVKYGAEYSDELGDIIDAAIAQSVSAPSVEDGR